MLGMERIRITFGRTGVRRACIGGDATGDQPAVNAVPAVPAAAPRRKLRRFTAEGLGSKCLRMWGSRLSLQGSRNQVGGGHELGGTSSSPGSSDNDCSTRPARR